MKIICHGDSLTEGKDVEPAYRWPALLQNILEAEVINTGIGGDTTAGLLSRFPMDVAARKPDVVILLGGTNDFWWNLSVNTALANLYTMAYQAQYHGIAPLFSLPMPFDAGQAEKQPWSPPEAGYEGILAAVNTLGLKLVANAKESEIPVLDFHGLFIDEDGQVCSQLLLEDGVHANRRGHKQMAELAAKEIRQEFLIS